MTVPSPRRPIRSLALAAAAIAGVSCSSLEGMATHGSDARDGSEHAPRAFLVYPVEKVRPDGTVRSKTSAIVRLAGGEYEALVLGVNGPATISGLRVATDAPSAGDDALRLAAYRIEYVQIERPSQWFACTRGRWPDPLVPLAASATESIGDGRRAIVFNLERPLVAPAGENRTLLLELYLSAGGRQDADLLVDILTDAGSARFAIEVRPWGFDLPQRPAFATAFGFSARSVLAKHRELAPAGLNEAGLTREYLHLLARFRISVSSPYQGTVGRFRDDGSLRWDWTGFDSVTGALLDGTLFDDAPAASSFAVPKPPKGISAEQAGEWYRGVEAHLRERGWLDRGYATLADEPMRREYPQVRADAAVIRNAAPGIRTLVTEPYSRALQGSIDIWCPDVWALGDSIRFVPIAARWPYRVSLDLQWNPPPGVYRRRAARGESAWLYTCLSAFVHDYPNLFIDAVGQSHRVLPWLAFRYGMSGLLYWETVYAYRAAGDPWATPYLLMTNGEGNLLYPGTPDLPDIRAHEPVPSLRLLLLRDGLEDYEYLAMLDRGGEGRLAARLARAAAPSSLSWPHDPSVAAGAREQAAARIAAAGVQASGTGRAP